MRTFKVGLRTKLTNSCVDIHIFICLYWCQYIWVTNDIKLKWHKTSCFRNLFPIDPVAVVIDQIIRVIWQLNWMVWANDFCHYDELRGISYIGTASNETVSGPVFIVIVCINPTIVRFIESWINNHCCEVGHETMICAVCLVMLVYLYWGVSFAAREFLRRPDNSPGLIHWLIHLTWNL